MRQDQNTKTLLTTGRECRQPRTGAGGLRARRSCTSSGGRPTSRSGSWCGVCRRWRRQAGASCRRAACWRAILSVRGGLAAAGGAPTPAPGMRRARVCCCPRSATAWCRSVRTKGAPSGIAALLVAAVPLWIIIYRAGDRATGRAAARSLGVLLGLRRAGRPDRRQRDRRRRSRSVPCLIIVCRDAVLVVRLLVDASPGAARRTPS